MPPTPILHPTTTYPGQPEYEDLLRWPFPPEPFYSGQVLELLKFDIPEKVLFGTCFTWVYRDAAGTSVGFGAVELCKEYEQFTGGRRHTYIPVIGVHPEFQGRGYGRAIVEHLVTEAVLFFHSPLNCLTGDTQEGFSDLLFLDVYSASTGRLNQTST